MLKELLRILKKEKEQVFQDYELEFENGIKFVAQAKEEKLEFKLQRNGKVLFDLKSFAPLGTEFKFSPKDEWENWIMICKEFPQNGKCFEETRMIVMVGKFYGIENLLDLLHEIGHLNYKELIDLAWTARLRYADEVMKDKLRAYPLSRLIAMKEEREQVLYSERQAWAFALRKVRELERRFGIDIFKRIGKAEDVKRYVDICLNKYEQGYLNELYNLYIYTKEQMENYFKGIAL